ncbi:NADH-quinone oxidoreductase subunit NuoN [Rhodococcus sp. HNM0569]|uniref:NADH-quinone oxidoreductase subunit NuoN n=1 Tax=Rhodococcus sp. HNM0569 TaxID=2716340 RepID=UPI00146F4076|nr:NADH-quinone oxidoreductase subunit NuoN [Rhodococcus sp. HNM0569]NLU84661.1 NADH-quinone oxidoreductase subunit NuoN [Rhodococcus sp. HNM0569]
MTVFAQDALPSPQIDYAALAPMLVVFGVAVVGVLVEAFAPRRYRYGVQLTLSLAGIACAFAAVVALAGTRERTAAGSVVVDGPALFLQGTILVAAAAGVLLMSARLPAAVAGAVSERVGARGSEAFTSQASTAPGSVAEREATKTGVVQTEVFPLTLFAVGGMMLFPASDDLLTLFVALEVFSLPLYLLCGMARHRRLLSQEAALKYFLLGAFSSAVFLYGVALLYGFAGTLSYAGIGEAAARGDDTTLAMLGGGLLTVGLLFKVGAVPFHSWVPDVYQGAPTPVTGFMAAATKVAAFGALLRVFHTALPPAHLDLEPVLWAVAILSMVVGAVAAVTQRDVKRMLAYSSIAHAGFLLTGVVAYDDAGTAATMFYLLAYALSTLGAFAVVTLVRETDGSEATGLDRWAGLGRRSPVAAGVFALMLLSMAGIPLTSGFVAKLAVFGAASGSGAWVLVVVGVLSSAVAAVFYMRVIAAMYFTDAPDDAPTVRIPGAGVAITIGACSGATLVLGILPQPLLDLAERASSFL